MSKDGKTKVRTKVKEISPLKFAEVMTDDEIFIKVPKRCMVTKCRRRVVVMHTKIIGSQALSSFECLKHGEKNYKDFTKRMGDKKKKKVEKIIAGIPKEPAKIKEVKPKAVK